MAQASQPGHEGDGLPGVERLLGLTDGVVAIALTLLVLQLLALQWRDPTSASALASARRAEGDQFISYIISFYVVGQFWMAQHRVFREITGHREGLAPDPPLAQATTSH